MFIAFEQDVDPAVKEARERLRMYGIDQFNVSRLAQLFLALDDPHSIRFDLPVEDKNRIRTAITDTLRAKSIAVLRSELMHTSDEFLDICYLVRPGFHRYLIWCL